MKKLPNPGSEKAREQGCTCPILDNAHGQGSYHGPGTFIIVEGCPLHQNKKYFEKEWKNK